MSSVNSPACLLARNHFHRNFAPSPTPLSAVFSCQKNSVRDKQRQVAFWAVMATAPGLPGGIGTKELWVNIALDFYSYCPSATSKLSSPADRGIK